MSNGVREAYIDLTFDLGNDETLECMMVASEADNALAVEWLNFEASVTAEQTGTDGRLIYQGELTAKQQRFEWSAQDLGMSSSGIYFVKIQSEIGKVEVLKLTVLDR